MTSTDLYQTAIAAAEHYGIPPNLFLAQIQQESGFNPNAVNGSAQGIAQFTPQTATQYGVSNPYDPTQALYGAAAYDAALYGATGSYSQMLSEYGTTPATGGGTAGQQALEQAASSLDSGNPTAAQTTLENYAQGQAAGTGLFSNLWNLITNPSQALASQNAGAGLANAMLGAGTGSLNPTTGQPQSQTSPLYNIFIRGAVILLGLVFVIGGIMMLRAPGNINIKVVPDKPAQKEAA